ncbi:hypothetical protein L0F63_006970 [Massospora cicadina]|nr:hypothetical protein L0F63_006970 [Massospora cicadina]
MEIPPKQITRKFSVAQALQISQPFGSVHTVTQPKDYRNVAIAVADCDAVCHGGLAVKAKEGFLVLGEEDDYYLVKSMTKVHETAGLPPPLAGKQKLSFRPDTSRTSLRAKQLRTPLEPNADKLYLTRAPVRYVETPSGRLVEFKTVAEAVFRSVDEIFGLFKKFALLFPVALAKVPPQTFEALNGSLDEVECFIADLASFGKDSPILTHLQDFFKERPADLGFRVRPNPAATLACSPQVRMLSADDVCFSTRDSVATSLAYLPRIKVKLHYNGHIYAFWLQTPSYTALYDHLVSRVGLPPETVTYLSSNTLNKHQPSTLRIFVEEV